jgi:hypothetical protein
MNRQDSLSQRISEIRDQLYGEFGLETLARALEVPEQTWRNYERVTMPAHILLKFLDITGSDPNWLLTGEGERFLARSAGDQGWLFDSAKH